MHEEIFNKIAREEEKSIQVRFEDRTACDRLRLKLINERKKYSKVAPVDAGCIYIARKQREEGGFMLTIYKKVDVFQVFVDGKDVTADYIIKGR